MQRKVGVRLAAEGGRDVRGEFDKTGDAGDRAFDRIRRSAQRAGPGLRLFNAAAGEARDGMEGLASRTPAVSRLARVLGPAGLLGGAAVGAMVGLAAAAKSAAAEIAEIGDAADRSQFDVDEYEKLKAALTIEGQDDSGLESSISSLVRKVGEARSGIGEGAKLFEQLGVSIVGANGVGKSNAELIDDIADAFERLPDGATRAAVAQKLFEEGGRALVTVLDDGAEGYRKTVEEARNLGLLYGGDLIRSAQQINAQFGIQSEVIGVQLRSAFVQMAPIVSDLIDRFVSGLPDIVNFIDTVLTALGVIDVSLDDKIARRDDLRARLNRYDEEATGSRGVFRDALIAEIGDLDGEIERAEAVAAQRDRLRADLNRPAAPVRLGNSGGGASDAEKQADAFDKIIERSGARTVQLIDQVELLGQADERAAFLTEKFRLVAELYSRGITSNDDRLAEIDVSATAFARETVELKRSQEAYKVLTEQKNADLTLSERLAQNREKLLTLLPQLIALTNDEAEARRVLADVIDRTEKDIKEKSEEMPAAFREIQSGLSSVVLGAENAGDAVSRVLGNMAQRLFDLALDPVWKQLAENFKGLSLSGGPEGGILGGLITSLGTLFVPSARGNAFTAAGVTPHARGDVVNRPGLFTFGNGRVGSVAESREEGILPLRRTAGGDLGVIAQFRGGGGGDFNVVNNITTNVDAGRGADAQQIAQQTANATAAKVAEAMLDRRLAHHMRSGGILDRTYQKKH